MFHKRSLVAFDLTFDIATWFLSTSLCLIIVYNCAKVFEILMTELRLDKHIRMHRLTPNPHFDNYIKLSAKGLNKIDCKMSVGQLARQFSVLDSKTIFFIIKGHNSVKIHFRCYFYWHLTVTSN